MWFARGVAYPDVVLVHGLYHQPIHMQIVEAELRSRGFMVHIPRLHRGSLGEDTRAVQTAVDDCHGEPIVVGHSYGGAVITGLERIRRLVYIAAFVPDVDENCAGLGGEHAPVDEWVRPHDSGGTFIRGADAMQLFYQDCPSELADWAAKQLVPQASGHGRGKPLRAAWKSIESTYLVCAQDRAVAPELQERMAQRCTTVVKMQASHSPYIADPAAVADVITSHTSDAR